MEITENMKVNEVLNINEKLEEVFERHNLPCSGCTGATSETLSEAAAGHDIDIKALLKDLNNELKG